MVPVSAYRKTVRGQDWDPFRSMLCAAFRHKKYGRLRYGFVATRMSVRFYGMGGWFL